MPQGQVSCLPRGEIIIGDLRGLAPRKSGLLRGEVATDPVAWPGTPHPTPGARVPTWVCLPSLPSARHSLRASGA